VTPTITLLDRFNRRILPPAQRDRREIAVDRAHTTTDKLIQNNNLRTTTQLAVSHGRMDQSGSGV